MPGRLKFRAWDHRLHRFNYFDLRGTFGRLPTDIPDSQIQQCTGLTDSEGRDVYEGDIVRFDNSDWSEKVIKGVGEVVFCGDLLLVESPQYALHFGDGFHPGMRGRFEIVGNSFENPEMPEDIATAGKQPQGGAQ